MAMDPFSVNPMFKTFLGWQSEVLKSQEPFWRSLASQAPIQSNEALELADKLWQDARDQSQEWLRLAQSKSVWPNAEGGISNDVMQRMMDPTQFLFAGSDEVNQAIQKLVEGPEFSDLGALERDGLRATSEWLALRDASAEYRQVTIKAWSRAFETFSEEMLGNREFWNKGPSAVMERWLAVANDELIRTQRTSEFLNAQRRLLRAGVDYRLRERELVEKWCETHSIPTRTEVDDLHETVYNLRAELRALKKELSKKSSSPAKKPSSTKRTKTAQTS